MNGQEEMIEIILLVVGWFFFDPPDLRRRAPWLSFDAAWRRAFVVAPLRAVVVTPDARGRGALMAAPTPAASRRRGASARRLSLDGRPPLRRKGWASFDCPLPRGE